MNIDKKSFGDIFSRFGLQLIHRYFRSTPESLLAVFNAFGWLHNFPELVDYCTAEDKEHRWNPKNWFENALNELKNGHCIARPEVVDFVLNGVLSENERCNIIEQAAKETLFILKDRRNILKFIETEIA